MDPLVVAGLNSSYISSASCTGALGIIYAAACRLILLIGSFKKIELKYNLQVIKKVTETSKPKKF